MRGLIGKLGFVHRRLWQRDGYYRVALLFGPAPLIGGLLAAGLWAGVQELPHAPPAWATPHHRPERWQAGAGQAQPLQPARSLPQADSNGVLAGYAPGWQVTARLITVSPTMDVDVKATPIGGMPYDGLVADLSQILARGPKGPLYVGTGEGFFVVRTPGTYAVTARFERPPAGTANCLTRIGFGTRRVVSVLTVDVSGGTDKVFDAARFDLQPGLYPIGWAFGCWQAQQVLGPGRLTVLIAHPGEDALKPARDDEIVRSR